MSEQDGSGELSRKLGPRPRLDVEGEGVYKKHRIHVRQLPNSRVWVASAVHFGASDSGVEPVRGDYRTKVEAVAAAKKHIDQEEEERPA